MIINGVRYALTAAVKAGLKTKYGQKQANKLIQTLRTSDNVPKNVQNFITRTFTKTGRLANIPAPTPVRSGVPRAQAIRESARAREVAADARKTQKRLITAAEVAGTGAVLLQRDKKPADISPKAKKAMNKAAAAVSQSKIKNKPPAKTSAAAKPKPKFNPEGIKKGLASKLNVSPPTPRAKPKSPPTPRAKPKSPPKKVSRNTAAALRQGMKSTRGELKTSLRAARAAGQLYYKDPETGRKMAAVLKSDLKPGQSLRDYINQKERKTRKDK